MAAVSPFGLTADALWDGLLSGRSAVRPIARFVAGGLPVTTGGEVPLEAADHAGDPPAAACKPFDRMRRGFALAEGGAALVLESLDAATARGAEVLGEVIGFGASQDAFDLNRPPPDGAGAKLCMRRALADAG